jgi:hypothetical protein
MGFSVCLVSVFIRGVSNKNESKVITTKRSDIISQSSQGLISPMLLPFLYSKNVSSAPASTQNTESQAGDSVISWNIKTDAKKREFSEEI